MSVNSIEEKHWHLDRFQRSALYWNNLANQQIFELNKQLLTFASILLPLSASIVVLDTLRLREYEILLLILGWIFLFTSIVLGLIQIWIDAKYFSYVSNDSSNREYLWSQDKDNNKIKDDVDKLGPIKPSSSFTPTLFQVVFVFIGLIFIMLVAVSILLNKNQNTNKMRFQPDTHWEKLKRF
jgi:heme/copper-type cytochrome/quinol oxidase subunit 4